MLDNGPYVTPDNPGIGRWIAVILLRNRSLFVSRDLFLRFLRRGEVVPLAFGDEVLELFFGSGK